MTLEKGKTVALVDPLWIGHHPMYFSQFTASFLRNGARVIAICPEPQAALRDLLQTVDAETAESLRTRVHFHQLPVGKRSFFNGRFEGDPARTFSRWKTAADTLADAEAASGMTADLVYFPYLDSYLRFLPFAAIPKFLLKRPWSGLYLRNHHHGETPSLKKSLRLLAKGDAILRSDLCRGIGVLDERFIPAMKKLCGIQITAYPDVTQAGLPAEPFPLAARDSSPCSAPPVSRGRPISPITSPAPGPSTSRSSARTSRRKSTPSAAASPPGKSTTSTSTRPTVASPTRPTTTRYSRPSTSPGPPTKDSKAAAARSEKPPPSGSPASPPPANASASASKPTASASPSRKETRSTPSPPSPAWQQAPTAKANRSHPNSRNTAGITRSNG